MNNGIVLIFVAIGAMCFGAGYLVKDVTEDTYQQEPTDGKIADENKSAVAKGEDNRSDKKGTGELEKDLTDARAEIAALTLQLEKAAEERDKLGQTGSDDIASGNVDGEGKEASSKNGKDNKKALDALQYLKFLENPKFLKFLESGIRKKIPSGYKELAELLGLSEEQSKEFYDLVLSQKMLEISEALALLKNDEQGSNLDAVLDAQQKLFDSETEISNFLGSGGFQTYADYEGSAWERGFSGKIASSFSGEYNVSAQSELYQVMQEERKGFSILRDFVAVDKSITSSYTKAIGHLNEDNFTEDYLQQRKEYDQRVAQRMSSVLTKEDHDKLVKQQERDRRKQAGALVVLGTVKDEMSK